MLPTVNTLALLWNREAILSDGILMIDYNSHHEIDPARAIALPIESLDMAKLARLNVAGGNIRNIALNAAFIAADAEEKVGMKHLLEASKSEYAKLERTLTDAEVCG